MIESKTDGNLCFIDSNIWLHAFINSQDSDKSIAARSVIRKNDIAISTPGHQRSLDKTYQKL